MSTWRGLEEVVGKLSKVNGARIHCSSGGKAAEEKTADDRLASCRHYRSWDLQGEAEGNQMSDLNGNNVRFLKRPRTTEGDQHFAKSAGRE